MHNLLPKSANSLAIKDAKEFILHLPTKAKKPTISMSDDGVINFLWKLPDFRMDLWVHSDTSTYSYYGTSSSGEKFMSAQEPLTKTLPEKILDFISHL